MAEFVNGQSGGGNPASCIVGVGGGQQINTNFTRIFCHELE